MGVILTGKMTFWGDKCLTKVDHAMKIGVLNIPAPVRMTPCPPRFYLTNQIIQNRRTTKPVILIPLKSLTFKWRRTCFHCNTHHPPTTQETFLELMMPPNQYRLTSSHDILIIWWRQVSWTSPLLSGWPQSSQTPTLDFVDGGHLKRENDILERQVLNKS